MAEFFLKEKFKEHSVCSAGLNPMAAAAMDPRSQRYLSSYFENIPMHAPQKINKSLVEKAETVFCLDPHILIELNKTFPKFHKKFKLLNYQMPKISLADPYKFNDKEYWAIMDNIRLLVSNLKL